MALLTKKWIGGLVLLFGLSIFFFCLIDWRTDRMIQSAYESCGAPDPISLKSLHLSAEQESDIAKLQEAYRKEVFEVCRLHCDRKLQLAKLLASVPRDETAILACSEEMARLQSQAEQLTTRHLLAMAHVMNPEQSHVFLGKVASGIEKTCPIVFAPDVR